MTPVYLSLAWLAGIALAGRLPAGSSPAFWLIPALMALLGLWLGRGQRVTRVAFGCGLLLALGAARLTLAQANMGGGELAVYNDQGLVTIEGIIDQNGKLRILDKINLPKSRRVIITILDEDPFDKLYFRRLEINPKTKGSQEKPMTFNIFGKRMLFFEN